MFTRGQYMAKECTHEQYYEQFVTPEVIESVRQSIGEDRIKRSEDEHFNDIPLIQWDNIGFPSSTISAFATAGDSASLAGLVCVAKAAARMIKEGRVCA